MVQAGSRDSCPRSLGALKETDCVPALGCVMWLKQADVLRVTGRGGGGHGRTAAYSRLPEFWSSTYRGSVQSE